MSTNVSLTPELETFAKDCVASGRYNNVSEVVRDALRRLQQAEDERRRFNAMLDAVQEDVERRGTHSLEEVLAEMDKVIDAAERR